MPLMALGGRLRPRLLSLQLQECIGDIYSSACSSAASSPALAARNWGLKFGSRDRKEEKTRWVKYQRCGLACCACVLSRVRLFWDPMEYSPPGSSVHRISQARILEWIAISSSRESSRPRDWTHVSWISALAGSSQEVKPVPQNAIKEHCRCRKEPGTVLAVLHVDKSYIKALSETGGKGPRKCSHKKASPPPSTPSPICKQKKESL